MADVKHTPAHPAQRSYGVCVFALKADDILVRDGTEYRVNKGFDTDPSACWRSSRWVQCTQLTGAYFKGAIQYVNPVGATVGAARATEGSV